MTKIHSRPGITHNYNQHKTIIHLGHTSLTPPPSPAPWVSIKAHPSHPPWQMSLPWALHLHCWGPREISRLRSWNKGCVSYWCLHYIVVPIYLQIFGLYNMYRLCLGGFSIHNGGAACLGGNDDIQNIFIWEEVFHRELFILLYDRSRNMHREWHPTDRPHIDRHISI